MNKASFIPLAWPETKVISEGKWYDYPMTWLGFIKNGYWSAGHAAFLTIDHLDGTVYYYDFGRYQTPKQHGRVRNVETDPELLIHTQARFNGKVIENLSEILYEVKNNASTHGDGRIEASVYFGIDLTALKQFVTQWQDRDYIAYGPLKFGGTNCSRFVSASFRQSVPKAFQRIKLYLPYTFSSTPMSNVRLIGKRIVPNETVEDSKYVLSNNLQYI